MVNTTAGEKTKQNKRTAFLFVLILTHRVRSLPGCLNCIFITKSLFLEEEEEKKLRRIQMPYFVVAPRKSRLYGSPVYKLKRTHRNGQSNTRQDRYVFLD